MSEEIGDGLLKQQRFVTEYIFLIGYKIKIFYKKIFIKRNNLYLVGSDLFRKVHKADSESVVVFGHLMYKMNIRSFKDDIRRFIGIQKAEQLIHRIISKKTRSRTGQGGGSC